MHLTPLQHTVDVFDGDTWRENTRKLYEYMNREFVDTVEQLQELFPATWENRLPIIRPVPFVHRLSRSLSTLYQKPASRRFIGRGWTPQIQQEVEIQYEEIGVNIHMMRLQEHLVAMNNAVSFVVPGFPVERGKVRLVTVPPHFVDIKMKDHLSTEPYDAEEVHIKLPVSTDPHTGLIYYGIARITNEEARWVDAPKKLRGEGLWFKDGSNPIGIIPLIILRGSEPQIGHIWAHENQDLLQAQRALNLSLTDIAYTSALQSAAIGVLRGVSRQHAEEIQIGPETMLGLPDPEMNLDFKSPKADIQSYSNSVMDYMKLSLSHAGLNPDLFLQSSGSISATAKQYDAIERQVEKTRHEQTFRRAEQRLWGLIRRWNNALRGNGVEVYPNAKVEVDFHEPAPIVDALHEAQALRMFIEDGQTSPAQALAQREGIPLEAARKRVETNIKDTLKTRAMNPAPVDGNAAQGKPVQVSETSKIIQ
tara:strand:+ start:1385 stop:2818 length:1434 start_codon:yes stop_codon:yes gene_type:complete